MVISFCFWIITFIFSENNLALFSCARALCKKCNADEKTKSKIIMAWLTDYQYKIFIYRNTGQAENFIVFLVSIII